METHIILIRGYGYNGFKDKHYQIISFVLVGGKQVRFQRCKNDPKRSPFDKIDESFFNHDSEIFDRLEHDRIFYKKSGLREITEY